MALNKIVMAFNGNQMPVLIPGGVCPENIGDLHSCMTSATHLKFLADWINVHYGIMSIGDLFIGLGDITFLPGLIIWAVLMIVAYNKST